jgi:hypothetical protein
LSTAQTEVWPRSQTCVQQQPVTHDCACKEMNWQDRTGRIPGVGLHGQSGLSIVVVVVAVAVAVVLLVVGVVVVVAGVVVVVAIVVVSV